MFCSQRAQYFLLHCAHAHERQGARLQPLRSARTAKGSDDTAEKKKLVHRLCVICGLWGIDGECDSGCKTVTFVKLKTAVTVVCLFVS